MPLTNFHQLRSQAQSLGPLRVAIICAADDVALLAAADALASNIARPVLIGDLNEIKQRLASLSLTHLLDTARLFDASSPEEASRLACRLALEGEADILLKGHLRSDELMRVVLGHASGLRTGRLLSDVLLYEDRLAASPRLVAITDGGLNVLPTLDHKRQIIRNAIAVLHSIGVARPRIALMSATEAVSTVMHSTIEAAALTEEACSGIFGEADVYGPLALDVALVASAARLKGLSNPVAGHADCLVAPCIESGNLLAKAVKYFGGSPCAHVVVGARVPILIPSRAESSEDKVNAIALGVVFRAWQATRETLSADSQSANL